MEILRSNVINSVDNIEDKPALGGLFGSEGFFFQQRRGHLDLRSIAAINLEKLVREVDVDVLQIHIENITFCNLREEDLRYLTDPQIVKLFRISQLMLEYLLYSQDKLVDNLNNLSHKYSEKKRGLSKKRRELIELEESTKLLRNQVKAKKQNIATLEDLLKEANRTREKELRKLRMHHKGDEIPEVKPSIIKFFIAGPEGLCVEFVEKAETDIAQLLREARKAFVSKRDHDLSYDPSMVELRLVFKGRLLLPEQTIEESDIRNGDTLMAMLVEPRKPDTVSAPAPQPAAAAVPAVDNDHFTREMFEMLSKQNQEHMRSIVQDINSGWKSALETLSLNSKPTIIERDRESAPHDPQALADMQGRWSRSELALQLKLEEVQHKQALSDQELNNLSLLAMRRRMKLGDLEDDEEPPRKENTPGIDTGMFFSRIERVEHQTTYTSHDVERMRAGLDELKRLLAQRPAPEPVPAVVTPAPEPVKPKEFKVAIAEQEIVRTRSNKWDNLHNIKSAAPVQAPVPKVAAKAVVFEMEAPVKPAPKVELPVETPKAQPPVVVLEEPKPVPAPVPGLQTPALITDVDVDFPAQFNPELSVLLFSKDAFRVTVPGDIPVDDLLFELRKAASTKTRTKFAKVALEYKGQRVQLGMDLEDDAASMTAEFARAAAASGDLRLAIMPGNPLTNAQIDMLVPSWEKNKVFASGGVGASEDGKEGKSSKAVPAGSKSRLKKRRDWDDEEPADLRASIGLSGPEDNLDPDTLARGDYRHMRISLDEALSEISEKEGLTDEELQRRISKIKDDSSSLPKPVSDHLRNYKGAMVGALAAAAADSGSDTGGGKSGAGDEMMRTSGGALSARGGTLSRSVSMSVSHNDRGSFGSSYSLLRMSGAQSPGDSMSQVSASNKMRRSLEQYDSEDALNSSSLLDDSPMLASLGSSGDFRRQTAAPGRPDSGKPPARVPGGFGIAHPDDDARTANQSLSMMPQLSASINPDTDSLMYSPSVSVSATARSRYSAEDRDDENGNSDTDDFHARRQPPAKPARTGKTSPESPHRTNTEDFRGRWAKHQPDEDASLDEGGWAAAARPVDTSVQSFGEDPEYEADAKARQRGGDDGKLADSVDSYKREIRKADRDEGFKGTNTGDLTGMSSIPTLNESVNSFEDPDSLYGDRIAQHGRSLGNTANSDLTNTGESETNIQNFKSDRPRGGSSRSNVEAFNGDDDNSINSLALSDSNNIEDM